MRKFLPHISIVVLAFIFFGCSSPIVPKENSAETGTAVESIFNQEDLQAFVERDPSLYLSYAGPFYFGNYDGVSTESKEYSEQRRENVDEIINYIDRGIGFLSSLDESLKEENEIFAWYVGEIQKIDASTSGYTNDLLNATDLDALSDSLANLKKLQEIVDGMELSPAWGYGQFRKYSELVELTNLYTVEEASLLSRTFALYYLLEADPNPAYQKLNIEFMGKLNPVSKETANLLNKLYHSAAVINYADQLVFTADYMFARDLVGRLDTQIADIKKSISQYDGSNELLSEKMLALLKKKAQDLEDYRNDIVSYLDSIPETELLSDSDLAFVEADGFSIFPIAYALPPESWGSPGWFQKKISTTISVVKSVPGFTKAMVKMAGEKVKDLYDKSGAHEVVKDGAQIINGGIEILNSGVEVSIHGAQGLYFGDMSWDDFKKKLEDEKNELHEKFVAGTLGKDQYDEMIRQMDQFKTNTDKFVDNMSKFTGDMSGIITGKPKIGEFVRNITKNVGAELKSPLDAATEFSKNIAIVMHPNTSKEDTRNALLNIYSALQGAKDEDGKHIELEIPNLKDLIKEKTIEEIQNELKGLGLSQEEEKEFMDELKEIFDKELRGAESKKETKKDSKETKKNDAVAEIFTNPNLTDKEIRDLILAEILKGLPPVGSKKKDEKKDEKEKENKDTDNDGIENEYDNCEEVANPNQADTDLDSLGDACDGDCSGDIDGDDVCNEVDNCPQNANPNQEDADGDGLGNVCDDDPPLISEIAGTWPGTITVTEVTMTPEFRESADENGCDIETIEESKDVPKPVSITVKPTSDNGGELYISGADMDDKSISFTYYDGILTASQSEDNSSINISMNFGRSSTTGSVDLDFLSGSAKVKAELNLEK